MASLTNDPVSDVLKCIRSEIHRRIFYYNEIIQMDDDMFTDELMKNNNEKLNKGIEFVKKMEKHEYNHDETDIIEELLFCVVDEKEKEEEEFELIRYKSIIPDVLPADY